MVRAESLLIDVIFVSSTFIFAIYLYELNPLNGLFNVVALISSLNYSLINDLLAIQSEYTALI